MISETDPQGCLCRHRAKPETGPGRSAGAPIRFREVQQRLGMITRQQLKVLEHQGSFPKRLARSGMWVAWVEHEVEAWILDLMDNHREPNPPLAAAMEGQKRRHQRMEREQAQREATIEAATDVGE